MLAVSFGAGAQICLHGIGGQMAVFGTNCLGQPVQGLAHAGSTVGIQFTAVYLDQCGQFGGGDESVVTNLTVSATSSCFLFTSTNRLTTNGMPQTNILNGQDVLLRYPSYTFYSPQHIPSGPFGGAAAVLQIPVGCSNKVTFTGNVQGYDTNSLGNFNVGGALGAQPSADLTVITPRLCMTKQCLPGIGQFGALSWSATLTNCGDSIITNITVIHVANGTNEQVFGPITLAPGESADYSGSYVVPINTCAPSLTDTVTARGTNICTGSNVTSTATATCPIIATPRLSLTKVCPPNPVAPGQLLIYSGIVSNSGTVTITNVIVTNDRPAPETPVLGPITLAPGQFTNFSGAYIAPYDCCGPCVDTLTARGKEFCRGSNVTATASAACPRVTTPAISVTRDCPAGPPVLGDLVFVTGYVSNPGNATLVNVKLVDDQAGVIMDGAALAPGESVWYLGMFITTNCGTSIPAGITATATDACFSTSVSNRFTTTCTVSCPSNIPVVLLNPHVADGNFLFSFQTESNATYKIQFSEFIAPTSWTDIATLPGTGALLTVSHTASGAQGFYRVIKQ